MHPTRIEGLLYDESFHNNFVAIVVGFITFIRTIIANKNASHTPTNNLDKNEAFKKTETVNNRSAQTAKEPETKTGDIFNDRECIPNYGGYYMDYVGQTKNGKPHGHGSISNRMSMVPYPMEEGEYVDGKLVRGRVYNSDDDSYEYDINDFDEKWEKEWILLGIRQKWQALYRQMD